MPFGGVSCILALLVCSVSGSSNLPIATPTGRIHNNFSPQGWSPKPTTRPQFRYPLQPNDLRRRDLHQTCGYVSGVESVSLGCPAGSYCGFYDAVGVVDCCSSIIASSGTTALNGCNPVTSCVDYSSVSVSLAGSIGTW